MQSWTCQRCLRAARTKLRAARRTASTSHKRPEDHGEDGYEFPTRHADATRSTNMRQAQSEPFNSHDTDLPLPPFLREPPTPSRYERYSKRFEHLPYTGYFKEGNDKTQRKKFKQAPFATVFAQNPYAHALATPVRECAFTNMRLPRSCLIDLHVADVPGSERGEVQMLPLSLAAALVPRKLRKSEHDKLTRGQEEAVDAWEEEEDARVPTGNASYMLAKREAVEFVGQDTKKRVMRYAVGRRVMMSLDKAGKRGKLVWREDMPGLILTGTRKVLMKNLRYHMSIKGIADKKGSVQAMPGMAGLERLDDVDGVLAVLRLQPSPTLTKSEEPSNGTEDSSIDGDPSLARESHNVEAGPSTIDNDYNRGLSNASIDESSRSQSAFNGIASNEGTPATKQYTAAQLDDSPDVDTQRRSPTEQIVEGSWQHTELKSLPFLDGIRQLDAPPKGATLYFPTVRYRNRRVAAYNLPFLLGDQMAADLIKDTVFQDVTHVALTMDRGLIDAHYMLQKLQAYLAGGKSESAKV